MMVKRKIKKIMTMVCMFTLAGAMLCGAAGCGTKKTTTSTIDVSTLQETLLSADTSLPDMTTVSSTSDEAESLFAYVSDLDYSKVESYLLSYSSEGLADEIVVIAVKDSADLDAAKETLETHQQNRVSFSRFILIFPDIRIWRLGWGKCSGSIFRKISIIRMWQLRLRISGGGGI